MLSSKGEAKRFGVMNTLLWLPLDFVGEDDDKEDKLRFELFRDMF
jgi:hypothetical protein